MSGFLYILTKTCQGYYIILRKDPLSLMENV